MKVKKTGNKKMNKIRKKWQKKNKSVVRVNAKHFQFNTKRKKIQINSEVAQI